MSTPHRREQEEEVRYGPGKEPPSRTAARNRLYELVQNEHMINFDLDVKKQENFDGEITFEVWERRAVGKLGYVLAELAFIRDWIAEDQAKLAAQNKPTHAMPASRHHHVMLD